LIEIAGSDRREKMWCIGVVRCDGSVRKREGEGGGDWKYHSIVPSSKSRLRLSRALVVRWSAFFCDVMDCDRFLDRLLEDLEDDDEEEEEDDDVEERQ